MPNIVAQMTEYSPKKIRGRMVTVMFSGYAVGGILAALIGKQFIELYGWQSVFIAAGAPVLLIPFIMKIDAGIVAVPDQAPRRHAICDRSSAGSQPGLRMEAHEEFLVPAEDRAEGAPVGKLFQRRSRPQHGDVLDRVLHGAVHDLRAQLVVDQADGDVRLQPGLGTDLLSGVAVRCDGRRHLGWLARRQVPHQVRADGHVRAGCGFPVPDDRQDLAGSAVPDRRSRGRVPRPVRRSWPMPMRDSSIPPPSARRASASLRGSGARGRSWRRS